METRDILDYAGNVIGTLSLPMDTPEEEWTARLAAYIIVPPSQSEVYLRKLETQQKLAPIVMNQLRLQLISNLASIADAAEFYEQMHPEITAVSQGAFEVAIYMLQNHTPSGPVTQEMLDTWVGIVKNYVQSVS